jgi:transposase
VVRHRFCWPKLSAISGVTPKGKLYFRVHPGSIKSPQVIAFLRHLLRHTRRPLVILWDGVGPHKSAQTRRFIEAHPRLQVHRLPPYCPDLNPDEWFWAHLKTRQLPNHGAQNLAQLRRKIRLAVVRVRRRPALIASFYRACALSSVN